MNDDDLKETGLFNEIFGGDSDKSLSDAELVFSEDEERVIPSFKKTAIKVKTLSKPRVKKPKPVEVQPTRTEAENDIEAALSRLKPKKSRRPDLQDEAEIDEAISELLGRMQNAAITDQEANANALPAVEKLKMLPTAMAMFSKGHWFPHYLENGILSGIKLWLEPLQDKSLPSLDIQLGMLNTLERMPIDTHHLRSSLIGRIVMFYTKCERVEPSVKRIASELVRRWIRPVLKRSSNYRDKEFAQVAIGSEKKRVAPARSTEEGKTRIPAPLAAQFDVVPVSHLNVGFEKKPDRYRKLKSTMKTMKYKNK